jgi:hypothetical protein
VPFKYPKRKEEYMEKIKILNTEHDITNIRQYGNLLEIEFYNAIELRGKNLSSLEIFTAGGVKCATLTGYSTIYKENDNIIVLSNDGSIYEEPAEPEPIEPSEPYVPSEEELFLQLENAKKNRADQSKTELDKFLEENPYLFEDGKYYAVTKEKQGLLGNAIAIYQMKIQAGYTDAIIKWNSTGEECTEWSIENITALALAIAKYVEPLVAQQQSIEVQINDFTSIDELSSMVIAYEKSN